MPPVHKHINTAASFFFFAEGGTHRRSGLIWYYRCGHQRLREARTSASSIDNRERMLACELAKEVSGHDRGAV